MCVYMYMYIYKNTCVIAVCAYIYVEMWCTCTHSEKAEIPQIPGVGGNGGWGWEGNDSSLEAMWRCGCDVWLYTPELWRFVKSATQWNYSRLYIVDGHRQDPSLFVWTFYFFQTNSFVRDRMQSVSNKVSTLKGSSQNYMWLKQSSTTHSCIFWIAIHTSCFETAQVNQSG